MPMRPSNLLQDFGHDLRFALRQLRRAPLFAATIVATFALGIAANTAIFSVMDALVLRPLAIPEMERVVTVAEQRGAEYPHRVSFADYQDFRQQSHAFSQLAARSKDDLSLTRGGQSEHVQTTRTTGNLFELFRMQPLLGRTFARRRRSAWARWGSGPDPRLLAVSFRQPLRRRRSGDHAGRKALHRHRRHAAEHGSCRVH